MEQAGLHGEGLWWLECSTLQASGVQKAELIEGWQLRLGRHEGPVEHRETLGRIDHLAFSQLLGARKSQGETRRDGMDLEGIIFIY